MKATQILTSIIIILMMAGSVTAAACTGFNSYPGNSGTASRPFEQPEAEAGDDFQDVVGISIRNPDDPTDVAETASASCDEQTINQPVFNDMMNLEFQTNYDNKYYVVGNPFASAITKFATVFNTQLTAAGNEIVVIYTDPLTGDQVAARRLTATAGDTWYARDVKIATDGTIFIYGDYKQSSAQQSTFLMSLMPGVGSFTVNYLAVPWQEVGTYNAQPKGLALNEDNDVAYILAASGNDLYVMALDTATGAISSAIRYPSDAPVTTGILDYGSLAGGTPSLITIFFDTGVITAGAVVVDLNGDVNAADKVYTTDTTVTDFTITGLTGVVVTEYGYVVAAAPCNDGINYVSCIVDFGYDSVWAARTTTSGMLIRTLDLYVRYDPVEEDFFEFVAFGASNGNSIEIHEVKEYDGTHYWGVTKSLVKEINDIEYEQETRYGEYVIAATGKASTDEPFVGFWDTTGNNRAFTVFPDNNGEKAAGQIITPMVGINEMAVVSNSYTSIMIFSINYPAPAPEFSLTTLLLATLLAGGLVLFVVRRRYK